MTDHEKSMVVAALKGRQNAQSSGCASDAAAESFSCYTRLE
jgi:hypothetical protein